MGDLDPIWLNFDTPYLFLLTDIIYLITVIGVILNN